MLQFCAANFSSTNSQDDFFRLDSRIPQGYEIFRDGYEVMRIPAL